MLLSTSTHAHDDAPKLAAALQRAQARIRELEHENNALRTELRWIDRLLAVPGSIMSPSQKVTLRAAVKAHQKGTPDENGLVQIESWKLCKTVGQSRQTFLENLTYCVEKLGILTKKRERLVESATNDYTTNLYIGVTPLLAHPQKYKVEQPRNHGGQRQLCPHCHSDRLRRKVTITCMSCGSVLDEKISLVNQGSHLDAAQAHQDDRTENAQAEDDQEPAPHTNVNLTPIKTSVLESQLDDSGMLQQEPATPPASEMMNDGDATDAQRQEASAEKQPQAQPALSTTETLSQADVLVQAVRLLVEIAGPEPVHIEMADRGPKKYYEVKRAITAQDARAHLRGWKTKGAYQRRPDGMTRAVCYDADTPQDWEHLLDAARRLAQAGYLPIVEDSPVGRGGHLWILYTRLASALAAHQHLVQAAPMLQHLKECWPGPGPNKVRLPGGKYVKPGFSQWCKLHDAHGVRIAEDGQTAARVLLDYQTPADIIAQEVNLQGVLHSTGSLACYAAPVGTEPCPTSVGHRGQLAALPNNDVGQSSDPANLQEEKWSGCEFRNAPGVDHHWQQKYSQHLWFQFTPEQLAAWYNERHQVQDILPPEKNGMGLASWRGEHTASVGLREDGWVDFGASARRSDGKQDGGDALELIVRLNDELKPEVMREIARQLVSEAREAMESAAWRGEPPPQWVQAFMSPAGWAYYHHLCEEAGYSDEAALAIPEPAPHTRGVTGFYASNDDILASHTQTDQGSHQPRESVQAVPDDTPRRDDTPEALAAELGIALGESCKQCGCTLRYHSREYLMCHKCHPRPVRLGGLNDEQWRRLLVLFPRRAGTC